MRRQTLMSVWITIRILSYSGVARCWTSLPRFFLLGRASISSASFPNFAVTRFKTAPILRCHWWLRLLLNTLISTCSPFLFIIFSFVKMYKIKSQDSVLDPIFFSTPHKYSKFVSFFIDFLKINVFKLLIFWVLLVMRSLLYLYLMEQLQLSQTIHQLITPSLVVFAHIFLLIEVCGIEGRNLRLAILSKLFGSSLYSVFSNLAPGSSFQVSMHLSPLCFIFLWAGNSLAL